MTRAGNFDYIRDGIDLYPHICFPPLTSLIFPVHSTRSSSGLVPKITQHLLPQGLQLCLYFNGPVEKAHTSGKRI